MVRRINIDVISIHNTHNNPGDCSCNTFVDENGFGNCEKVKVEGDKRGPICYVNKPSTCKDLVNANGMDYSWEACNVENKSSKTISE